MVFSKKNHNNRQHALFGTLGLNSDWNYTFSQGVQSGSIIISPWIGGINLGGVST